MKPTTIIKRVLITLSIILIFILIIHTSPALDFKTFWADNNYEYWYESKHWNITTEPDKQNKVCFKPGSDLTIGNSGSMMPTLNGDDIVCAYKPKYDDIDIGDIVIYDTNNDGQYIHRIVEKNQNGTYIMKGDRSYTIDPYFPTNKDILYKVYSIEYK